jgi:hypothetical protein
MSRCCHVETVVLVLLLVLLVASPGLAAAFTIGGGRIVVETSALAGESVGVESSTFSRYRAVTEVGLHWEGEDVRWEGGFSLRCSRKR